MLFSIPYYYSKKQIAEGSEIGKVTLFKYWPKLEEADIVKVSRKSGRTKFYKLNTANKVVKRLLEIDLLLGEKAAEEAVAHWERSQKVEVKARKAKVKPI